MEVILAKRNVSVYTNAELEGESGVQQAPSQTFALTEAMNRHIFA